MPPRWLRCRGPRKVHVFNLKQKVINLQFRHLAWAEKQRSGKINVEQRGPRRIPHSGSSDLSFSLMAGHFPQTWPTKSHLWSKSEEGRWRHAELLGILFEHIAALKYCRPSFCDTDNAQKISLANLTKWIRSFGCNWISEALPGVNKYEGVYLRLFKLALIRLSKTFHVLDI